MLRLVRPVAPIRCAGRVLRQTSQGARTMPKSPDRAMLSQLVEAYDEISEESLGLGDPEFHEIEAQLFDAIVDSPYRAVIKNGNIYLPDPNGSPGELVL